MSTLERNFYRRAACDESSMPVMDSANFSLHSTKRKSSREGKSIHARDAISPPTNLITYANDHLRLLNIQFV